MTNKHVETLRELIERWRKESDDFERDGDEGSAASYYNCADELEGAIALMRGQPEPVELTDNEKIAMQVFGELKGMRGDFTESDPDQLAEFASMCLNTVIHLGLLVERALPAPPKDTADEQ